MFEVEREAAGSDIEVKTRMMDLNYGKGQGIRGSSYQIALKKTRVDIYQSI